MLMNLETLEWDKKLCKFFNIPEHILPTIKSCSEIYGFIHDGPLRGVPVASVGFLLYLFFLSLIYI